MFTGLALETVRLGLKDIYLHKLRSFLTTLGIICGVGAVICMLSISEGASESEMALIRLLGTQNVIVQSIKPEGARDVSEERSNLLEYGLTARDLELVTGTIPQVQKVVPLREVAFEVGYGATRLPTEVVGAPPAFFDVVQIKVARGRPIQAIDQQNRSKVCIIGDDLRVKLFAYKDPIGECILVNSQTSGTIPFEIVGVLERVLTAGSPAKGIGERNINGEVFIPLSTADDRYSDLRVKLSSGSREFSRCMYSDFYIQVASLDYVVPVSEMVRRALEVRHEKMDY